MGMRRKCAKFVPRSPTDEPNKKCIFKTREDFIHNYQTKTQVVSYIITGGEYWKCQYDPQTNLGIMDCRITTLMKTKKFVWESQGSSLCSSLYFWWAGCNTQKMCACSKNCQEWRLYTNTGNVSGADIGSEAKITRKINWLLSKQKDVPYSTIMKIRLPANRCVLEISHQPDSPGLELAEFFCSVEGKTTFN